MKSSPDENSFDLKETGSALGKPLSGAARAAVDAYPWRRPEERDKAIAEAMLVAFGEQIEFNDLPLPVRQFARRKGRQLPAGEAIACVQWKGEPLAVLVEQLEKNVIAQAFAACHGNAAAAARALGCSARIIRYRVRKLGISR